MKNALYLSALTLFIFSSFQCGKDKLCCVYPNLNKAKLAVKGDCLNYTFTLLEGDMDPSLTEAEWTDPQTNKTYKNAFGVANPCDLPGNLKEGDTVYFTIIEKGVAVCGTCGAYYPTPSKKLTIQVN